MLEIKLEDLVCPRCFETTINESDISPDLYVSWYNCTNCGRIEPGKSVKSVGETRRMFDDNAENLTQVMAQQLLMELELHDKFKHQAVSLRKYKHINICSFPASAECKNCGWFVSFDTKDESSIRDGIVISLYVMDAKSHSGLRLLADYVDIFIMKHRDCNAKKT